MQKRTILIVDDQKINRMILGKILSPDYEVLYAENGKEALACLHQNRDLVSAVLLDIIMPIMNGYEVLEEMSKDRELSMIPVIVSSQENGDEAEIKALSLGAQDFIAKPYKADIIRHRLVNLIKLRETAAVINKVEKDELTGLYNKQFFMSKLQDLVTQDTEKKYDLFCFGVERFKLINDTYGIKKGDETLQFLAGMLKELFSEYNLCGRFGADNFYAVIPHHETYTQEMFRKWMEQLSESPVDIDIKLHCGIYTIDDPTLPAEVMCDRAQLAAEKNRGRYEECFTIYDDSIRQKLIDEQFITSTMQTALEQEQFIVYYQPKYDLNTELIAGAEALVRWIHPVKGFMSPGDFIPIFEKNGFITQLDEYVWETTCKNIQKWMQQGKQPVAVSVNVSRADIYNPKLIDTLMGFIHKYEVPIQYLHLEITESAYTDNPTQIIEKVKELRRLGFVIEMDDFGSGYSSLNMLAEMPVDVLKLDMRFIQTEATEASGKGILSFIISLAKWLSLAVVAEGVETAEQIAVLRSMDCNYVQGFYFAKPMKVEEFEALMNQTKTTEMVCTSRTAAEYVADNNPIANLEDGRVMLVIDDIEINRAALAACFMDEYVIVEKENGKEAWDYLVDNYEKVDMIMLDLLMPVMDGFELLKKIRADEHMKEYPVIITSQGDADSEHRALELKADDFISKPYNADIIRHRVANVAAGYQLKLMREGLLSEEEILKHNAKQDDSGTMNEHILQMIDVMKAHFDLVRLVDPRDTIVYEPSNVADEECDIQSCFSVWGKTARCVNCTSMKAYEERTRVTKLEENEEGTYFVVSEYVPYGAMGAVMEIVTRLDK